MPCPYTSNVYIFSVYTVYHVINGGHSADHLPTSSCPRNFWITPSIDELVKLIHICLSFNCCTMQNSYRDSFEEAGQSTNTVKYIWRPFITVWPRTFALLWSKKLYLRSNCASYQSARFGWWKIILSLWGLKEVFPTEMCKKCD